MEFAKSRGTDPHAVEAATLTELMKVVAKSKSLLKGLDDLKRKRYEHAASEIVNIRNVVMHPVRPLIRDQESVRKLAGALQTVDELQERVDELVRNK